MAGRERQRTGSFPTPGGRQEPTRLSQTYIDCRVALVYLRFFWEGLPNSSFGSQLVAHKWGAFAIAWIAVVRLPDHSQILGQAEAVMGDIALYHIRWGADHRRDIH